MKQVHFLILAINCLIFSTALLGENLPSLAIIKVTEVPSFQVGVSNSNVQTLSLITEREQSSKIISVEPNKPNNIVKAAILNEAREKQLFTLASYRTYLGTALFWGYLHLFLGAISASFAALAGNAAFKDKKNHTIWFSIVATIAATLLTFLNPTER